MAREPLKVYKTEDIQSLIVQLNKQLRNLNRILIRIEGFESSTSEFHGDMAHTGSKVGFFSKAKATQALHVTHAVTSHGSATTTELDALGVVINNIITAVERHGLMADS